MRLNKNGYIINARRERSEFLFLFSLPSNNFRFLVRLYVHTCVRSAIRPPVARSVVLEQRCMYIHRVGHVAVRVQWPGVVVRVALRVVCGGGTRRNGAELRTEHPSDRYSNGGVVRPSSSGARVRTSHKMALPEKRRPGQNTAAHGRKDHVESVRVAPPSIAPASTVTVKTRSGVGARARG